MFGVISISSATKNLAEQLKLKDREYAKKESVVIIKKMYYNPSVVCLSRKRKKIEKALEIEKIQQKKYAQVEKLVDFYP